MLAIFSSLQKFLFLKESEIVAILLMPKPRSHKTTATPRTYAEPNRQVSQLSLKFLPCLKKGLLLAFFS